MMLSQFCDQRRKKSVYKGGGGIPGRVKPCRFSLMQGTYNTKYPLQVYKHINDKETVPIIMYMEIVYYFVDIAVFVYLLVLQSSFKENKWI